MPEEPRDPYVPPDGPDEDEADPNTEIHAYCEESDEEVPVVIWFDGDETIATLTPENAKSLGADLINLGRQASG